VSLRRLHPPICAESCSPNWTGFYVFGGGGGGIWNADSNEVSNPGGTPLNRDQRFAGHGAFGTVGAGYDWQFAHSWVAGVFADGMFGALKGNITDQGDLVQGAEKLRTTWAAGARVGYLVAPNVLSYVNAGYTGSEWSGVSYTGIFGPGTNLSSPSFERDGWFVGGGVETSLSIFGITAPGWNMKTEYRAAYFDRATLPLSFSAGDVNERAVTFNPWVQTISASLVYRFNSGAPTAFAADLPVDYAKAPYLKAPPPMAPSWTGFYVFGGAGGGIWDADSDVPFEVSRTPNQPLGGSGWFGTVGAGYDWQFGGPWVAGVFADGMFGSLKGSLSDQDFGVEGTEKLRTTWAVGARAGYLVAPSVLSYVNAGYTGSEWSGAALSDLVSGGLHHAFVPS
jgi:outer membrane immunogenic protein